MSRSLRIVLLALLLLSAAFSGWRFKGNYDAIAAARAGRQDTDLTQVAVPDYQNNKGNAPNRSPLGLWGAGLVLSLVAAGFIVAHEVSQYVGARAVKALYNDDAEGPTPPDYEAAEAEWAKGNYLHAIELLREYLQDNPREQHVAIRIAEIYEKDLQNPLAAALEYEEVLNHKLPPERWGWAAIHLCNLYSGRLDKPDKAIALLHRIVAEYGQTAAGGKARTRLEQLAADGIIPPLPEAGAADATSQPPAKGLPPGFAPKKQ